MKKLSGFKVMNPNNRWKIQLYYPEFQLQADDKGRDFFLKVELFTIRVDSFDDCQQFAIKLLGFGFGVQRLTDKEMAYRRSLKCSH